MVGFIPLRSKPATVDGFMDVSTPTIIPIWEFILGTHFRTMRDDQLCSTLASRQFKAKQFIPAIAELISLEITYGKPEEAQLLNQIMQAWKDPHKIRLGQLIGGCTPKYTV